MRKQLRGWNFNPSASFGTTEAQTPLIFPALPVGWAEPGAPAQGFALSRIQGGRVQAPGGAEPRSPEPRQCCDMHIVSSQHRC